MMRLLAGPAGKLGAPTSDAEKNSKDCTMIESMYDSSKQIAIVSEGQSSWLAMLNSLGVDARFARRGLVEHGFVSVAEVLEGSYDLLVPNIAVTVASVKQVSHGRSNTTYSLILKDETGSIDGFLSLYSKKENLLDRCLETGETLILENVSVFVQSQPFVRLLNLHAEAVIAVFSVEKASV